MAEPTLSPDPEALEKVILDRLERLRPELDLSPDSPASRLAHTLAQTDNGEVVLESLLDLRMQVFWTRVASKLDPMTPPIDHFDGHPYRNRGCHHIGDPAAASTQKVRPLPLHRQLFSRLISLFSVAPAP